MSAPDNPRTGQLGLPFPLSSRCQFETFEVGGNGELVRRLETLDTDDAGFRGYYLFAPPGTGRTHLLQAACQRHGGRGGAIYLPLADPAMAPGVLEGLERCRLVALDDVERWIGEAEPERALLALYQALHGAGARLLVSAAVPCAALDFHFADLGSRLRGLSAYQVQPLTDAGKARVLARVARERGLELSDPVLGFWLSRSGRDLPALLAQLDRLDTAAMAAQRRVTVPLIKDVLGL